MSDDRGRMLAKIARRAIESALGGLSAADPDDDWLKEDGATFVTITRRGQLHGCIGTIEAKRSLMDDVKHNAVAAALRDPRATVLSLADVAELRIEISRLSPLQAICFTDEAEALAQLQPHIDGVVLAYNGRRATFLPQVWSSLSGVVELMAHLKQKAGLRADFWAPSVQLFRYSIEKWKEPERSN